MWYGNAMYTVRDGTEFAFCFLLDWLDDCLVDRSICEPSDDLIAHCVTADFGRSRFVWLCGCVCVCVREWTVVSKNRWAAKDSKREPKKSGSDALYCRHICSCIAGASPAICGSEPLMTPTR